MGRIHPAAAPAALAFPAALALALGASACPGRSEAGLPLVKLVVDGKPLNVEVARSVDEKSRGLMYRRELPESRGMLFVYEEPETLSFWMKNTFVALSIAYIDRDGIILQIEDMQPQTTTTHPSRRPAMYALEVNRGWFQRHEVEVGDRVVIPLARVAGGDSG